MVESSNKKRSNRLYRLGLMAAAGVLLVLGLYEDAKTTLDTPLRISEPVTISLRKGDGLSVLAEQLKQKKLLVEPFWLKLLVLQTGSLQRLRFGVYRVMPGTTQRGLLDLIVRGRTVETPITIAEGLRFKDLIQILKDQAILRLDLKDQAYLDIMRALGEPDVHPEGQFFPDTYYASESTTELDILKKAHKKMNTVLQEEWQERAPDLPLASPYEALILASIVEKETGHPEERAEIAGVFLRRLLKGMRLQTDPTVIYGMGEAYQGNIRKEDLRRDTPYNTYTRNGLPPTPIALPGREAIHAVLHPAAGTSLYFVARGGGRHHFSSTLEEHERAVDQFQRHPERP